MASGLYQNMGLRVSLTNINTLSGAGDLVVLLMQSAYTYDPDHEHVSDLTSECSAGGYSRQYTTVVSAPTYVAGSNRGRVELTDTTFASLATGQTISGAVVADDTNAPTSATMDLLAWIEFAAAVPTTGGDITVNFAADTLQFNL